jgi:hypothetical protein
LDFETLQEANATLCQLIEEFDAATGQPEPRKTIFDFTVPSGQ